MVSKGRKAQERLHREAEWPDNKHYMKQSNILIGLMVGWWAGEGP